MGVLKIFVHGLSVKLKIVPMRWKMSVSCVQGKAAVGSVLQVGEDHEGSLYEGSHAVLPSSYPGWRGWQLKHTTAAVVSTVVPVMNGHPRDQAKVSVHCRWPLIRGNLTLKCVGRGIDNVAVPYKAGGRSRRGSPKAGTTVFVSINEC